MDTTDARLLEVLRERGRVAFAELGRHVGLSGPAVQERIRRLEERGVLKGFRAIVDPAAVGFGVGALVGISVSDGAEIGDVARRLRDVQEIEDCWVVAGEEEFVVKVRAADVAALAHVVGKLRRLRGVSGTRTTVVLATRWEGRPVPLPTLDG